MTPAGGPAYVAAVVMLYVDLPDTPIVRGMLHKVRHLVRVDES